MPGDVCCCTFFTYLDVSRLFRKYIHITIIGGKSKLEELFLEDGLEWEGDHDRLLGRVRSIILINCGKYYNN